jgi:DNA-binding NarL/FixJ family response regulator
VALIERLRVEAPAAKILVLSGQTGDEALRRALLAGALGIVLKSEPGQALVEAVRKVMIGRVPLSAQAAVLLAAGQGRTPLSEREIEVLQLAAEGAANKQIAERLGLAENTVKNHMKAILKKLEAADRTGGVVAAIRRGIIQLENP